MKPSRDSAPRRWRRSIVVCAATIAPALLLAAPAGSVLAAAPSRWQPVATGGMNVSDQVGLARTPDGVLHVAWRRRGAAQDLLQTPIAAGGRVGAPVAVVQGWASVGSPALVAHGQALTAFFPGTETPATGDPRAGLDAAASADGGATWTVGPAAIAGSQFAGASTPAALATPAGALLQAWSAPEGTVVHAGLDPAVPAAGGYGPGTDQALAGTADGQAMVAWCTEPGGVFVAAADPASGRRAGPALRLAGTGRCPADSRVAIVGIPYATADPLKRLIGDPGFYEWDACFVAASDQSGRRVRVFQVQRDEHDDTRYRAERLPDASSGRASSKQQIAFALAPRHVGGSWAAWRDSDTDALVFRHSFNLLDWGAEVVVRLPPRTSLSQLQVDAQDDRLDALARIRGDDDDRVSVVATQVRPGLTLAGGTRLGLRRRGFHVLDATRAVGRATVRVAGRTLTATNGGYARVELPPGTYTATASKPGYVSATIRFTLR